MTGKPPEEGREQEIAALRSALLAAVPTDLQAPPDRMRRVRGRVRRARGLRAAAAAVPLLALAAVLAPHPGGGAADGTTLAVVGIQPAAGRAQAVAAARTLRDLVDAHAAAAHGR
ncbi:hypothetical protein [Peterkaempfera griseoplana]|uniref:hypothetical protein n=1 Tax=Peterkaempfera griseoplana TaxID=66896 RepID=UPI0006E3BC9B|nr:hypothetical protein [Peterkaempfera griseoplana]